MDILDRYNAEISIEATFGLCAYIVVAELWDGIPPPIRVNSLIATVSEPAMVLFSDTFSKTEPPPASLGLYNGDSMLYVPGDSYPVPTLLIRLMQSLDEQDWLTAIFHPDDLSPASPLYRFATSESS